MRKLFRTKIGSFTLIELLVVIAIIGILAAIAIPQFAAYRRRGYDADVKANLRNAATAEEAYFTDNDNYTSTIVSLVGYNQSVNVDITPAGTSTTYRVTAAARNGCGGTSGSWNIDSLTGRITGVLCGP